MIVYKYVLMMTDFALLVVCITLLAGTLQQLSKQWKFKKKCKGKVVSAEVKVVETSISWHCDGNGFLKVPVYFCECLTVIDCQEVMVTVQSSSPRSAEECISFWYNPDNPKETLEKKSYSCLIATLITAVLFSIFCVVTFV